MMETLVGGMPGESPQVPPNPIGPLLVLEIGKLQGTQATMLVTMNNLASDLKRIIDDVDKKHEQNTMLTNRTREELVKIFHEHSKEDDLRFARVNRVIWAAGGIFGFINFVLLVANLWKTMH